MLPGGGCSDLAIRSFVMRELILGEKERPGYALGGPPALVFLSQDEGAARVLRTRVASRKEPLAQA